MVKIHKLATVLMIIEILANLKVTSKRRDINILKEINQQNLPIIKFNRISLRILLAK